MRILVAAMAAMLLTSCGVETASTAATAAAVKKQEIEQGKKTMENMQQNLDKAMQQTQQSADRAESAATK